MRRPAARLFQWQTLPVRLGGGKAPRIGAPPLAAHPAGRIRGRHVRHHTGSGNPAGRVFQPPTDSVRRSFALCRHRLSKNSVAKSGRHTIRQNPFIQRACPPDRKPESGQGSGERQRSERPLHFRALPSGCRQRRFAYGIRRRTCGKEILAGYGTRFFKHGMSNRKSPTCSGTKKSVSAFANQHSPRYQPDIPPNIANYARLSSCSNEFVCLCGHPQERLWPRNGKKHEDMQRHIGVFGKFLCGDTLILARWISAAA